MKKTHGNTGKRNAAKEYKLDGTLSIRCKREEKALWVKAAEGGKLQKFARDALNAYAKQANTKRV